MGSLWASLAPFIIASALMPIELVITLALLGTPGRVRTAGAAVSGMVLVRLLQGFAPPPTNIHVVYPSRRHLSAKVRVFADFLAARFATAEWVLETEGDARHRKTRARSPG